jgi:chorismate mutase|tara:strand:+ start:699 stop:920 length:222 start_codon:yes stop_codon:yes gene_type:complete
LVQKETGSKGSETDQVPANDPILDEQREQKVVKRGKIIAAYLLPFNESAIHVQFQTLLENQIIDAIKNFKQGN